MNPLNLTRYRIHPYKDSAGFVGLDDRPDKDGDWVKFADLLPYTITVREVFSKAFGEVPEGATINFMDQVYWDGEFTPHIDICKKLGWFDMENKIWVVTERESNWYHDDKNISYRPAIAFRGFFGPEYNAALEELMRVVGE